MKNRRKNPYFISYLSLACIFCLVLIMVFFFVYDQTVRETQQYYHQKKIEMIVDDLDTQFEMFEEMALKLSINNKFQPYYFQSSKYNEMLLLDEFELYVRAAMLADESFLYYGGKNLMHSRGQTVDLAVYFEELLPEEREQILEILSGGLGGQEILMLGEKLYVLTPFRTVGGTERKQAVLAFVMEQSTLEQRMQLVSGGIAGDVTLYWNSRLMYGNESGFAGIRQSRILTTGTTGEEIVLCFLPGENQYMAVSRFPLMLTFLLFVAVLMLLISNLFAVRSYRPLEALSNKFRKEFPDFEENIGEAACENALEELNVMMEDLLRHNAVANSQIEQKQKMLRRQVLRTLLEGHYEFDMQQYLSRLQISLPGPKFFVITISLENCTAVSDEMLAALQEEMDGLTDEACGEYLYAICNYEKKQISVICSMTDSCAKEKFVEYVSEVAGSFGHEPLVGMGDVYEQLSRLSASWLESVDNISKNTPKMDGQRETVREIYDTEGLRQLLAALANGDQSSAEKGLEQYLKQLKTGTVSVLMQQYVFANFLSEITKASAECKVQLSNQCMSLLVAAKNAESFQSAAMELIRDFCQKYHNEKESREKDMMYGIYEYVKSHFAEYDMSIEKAAESLNVSTSMVREAVYQHTGKMYKDYLIYLRIEYAKELLLKEELAVAEICQRVGYGNVSYFIKLFKEMTGVTPAKYRLGK